MVPTKPTMCYGISYIHGTWLLIKKIVGDGLNLPPICCEAHRHEQLPFLIYEYVVLCYLIESKRFKNDSLQQLKIKSTPKKHKKMSKMVA
jgi:hypothetical protein